MFTEWDPCFFRIPFHSRRCLFRVARSGQRSGRRHSPPWSSSDRAEPSGLRDLPRREPYWGSWEPTSASEAQPGGRPICLTAFLSEAIAFQPSSSLFFQAFPTSEDTSYFGCLSWCTSRSGSERCPCSWSSHCGWRSWKVLLREPVGHPKLFESSLS